ncbi:Gp37 family protein [Iodobacter fluviatilis]|uniref:Gp37 protein n=1 Tax=Iodobacter fluviatilis TaxID=537 RepID=A0A377Q9J9_9NEIS|nr:Gp37 family protein [Iodobacter fluviatilis]TCU88529.1 Gp37 protein [Iodobacter fluviatilis]STQ91400.1 Gp37 protein [Iodobacter fluviatilis]
MASTVEILDAVVQRLHLKLPQLAVEYFPENAKNYTLNHSLGALLVSYLGSQFDDTTDTGFIAQPRAIKISITVVVRQLNGRGGAIEVLDLARRAIVGFRPPDCKKIRAVSEKFLGQASGLWQYALDISTSGMLVEDTEVANEHPLTVVNYEEAP